MSENTQGKSGLPVADPAAGHRPDRSRLAVAAAIALIMAVVLWLQFTMNRWTARNVIICDVIQYYSYLPALLHGDFSLRDRRLNRDFDYHAWALEGPAGRRVIKMPCGTSLFFAPFFALACLDDLIRGNEVNTYAPKFHLAVSLSAALFLCLGLLALDAVLRRHFRPMTRALTLLLTALGTNLLHYSTTEPGMSHVFSFFLFSWFLLRVQRWYDRPGLGNTLALGLVLGWIVLVRPTNGLLGLIFLLHGFPGNAGRLLRRWPLLLAAGVAMLAVFGLQMFYWKAVTGSWLYFSYAGEGFFFRNPRILEGLFSFRKGWFVYTPLMVPALAGLFLNAMPREWRWAVAAFLASNVYVVLSWWCWWYGGSYGLRAFIESYAVLALPLAALVESISRLRPSGRWAARSALALLLGLNLFQARQYEKTLIHWDSMNWRTYRGVFLRSEFPPDYATWLDPPDYERARKGADRLPAADRLPVPISPPFPPARGSQEGVSRSQGQVHCPQIFDDFSGKGHF